MRVSERHLEAVEALARGLTTDEAAALVGVNGRTIRKWRQEAAFIALLDRAQGELVAGMARRLRGLGAKAADTLGDVMADATAAPSARVSAAGRVLDAVFRLDEIAKLEQIEARIARLEETLARSGGS